MRPLITYLLIALLSFGFVIQTAEAGRFGGGRSFGVQRSHSSLFSQRAPHNAQPMGQRPNANKWGGVLGGLLAGGLLASLFMGHGLGSGLLAWLIVGALAFFVIGFLRKRMQPAAQTAQPYAFGHNTFNPSSNANPFQGGSSQPTQPLSEFDVETFLRAAKVTFIRLQTAYDQKNVQDILAFTTPDVFAEIKMQLDELGDEPNKTEVENLTAELLDASKQVNETIASVRFTGSVKENDDPMMPLDEIWHFRQSPHNDTWVVVGIQQEVVRP